MKFAWITGRFLLAGIGLLFAFVSLGSKQPDSSLVASRLAGRIDASENLQADDKTAEDLVKDWEKPEFVLFISGRQHGYIEPCGCVTLARQKGGLMRRHAVQKILQARDWDVVSIDAGNQVRRFGQQPLIKIRKTYEALCDQMGYEFIGLGPDDLKLPAIDLAQTIANVDNGASPFTCANVNLLGMTNDHLIVEKGGKRIGITMILGDEHLESIKQEHVETQAAAAGLKKVIPKLADCDFKVLVAFADLEASRKLANQFPEFDVLVTAGGYGDPTLRPEIVTAANGHQTAIVQVGVKGMHVGLIGYFEKDGKSRIEYERVELTDRFKDSDEIKKVFKSYQDELKTLWETGNFKDIVERDHPSGNQFVGSSTCADCHDEEYAIWEDGAEGGGGPHEEATRDLELNPNDDRVWVQRHFDPECVSCHVTGWNPQDFYPYKTGYSKLADEDLHGNGCENCHGPGSAHVAMEELVAKGQAVDPKERVRTIREMYLSVSEARLNSCKECHDLDNSPDFLKEGAFDDYWPQVAHGRPAMDKIEGLLNSVSKGTRPVEALSLIEDWTADLGDQEPTKVAEIEAMLNALSKNPNKALEIVNQTLKGLGKQ
tara:strand:- start:1118 stop:2920 length:1803 start_codon:yes stop_codon:yes gene_type:complete